MRETTKEKTRRRLAWVLAVTCALAAIVSLALLPASASAMPEEQVVAVQGASGEALPAEDAAPADEDTAGEPAELPAVEELEEAADLADEDAAAEPELEPAADEPALEPAATVPIYRLYNWRTSEHLFTKSRTEYDSLPVRTKGDWVQEGIAWYAPDKSRTPVYRLYNPRSGDHHYTTNAAERDVLVRSHGWRSEGTAFYSDDYKRVAIHRVYNRRLTRGQHHYTTSASERDSLVRSHGWRSEGVGFYGVRVGKTEVFSGPPVGTYWASNGDWIKIFNKSDDPGSPGGSGYVTYDNVFRKKWKYTSAGYLELVPAGPYDFVWDGDTEYRNLRYDPTTNGGCLWVSDYKDGYYYEVKYVRY